MDATVFAAVLAAAALHAGWNALVKAGPDRFLAVALVTTAAGLASLPLLALVAVPRAEAWPWLAGSVVLHTFYNLSLVRAYQLGELGQVYPIARGGAPLLVAAVGALVLGERLGGATAVGVGTLALGVGLMAARGAGRGSPATLDRRAVPFAALTACFVAGYTVVDGLGARLAGAPIAYTLYLFVLDGAAMLAALCAARGAPGLRAVAAGLPSGLAGGLLSLCSYGIAIWAMTLAPLATVAALRETSVLWALLISAVALRERLTAPRLAAGLLIVAGAAVLRLA